ncbi:hypothetical protein FSP39_008099 [Pinctada imbricata]|uniref:Dual specificity protein phosphatase n=1 Tax=Pinctada imbricata TaxID=66713 RepID=A0AA88XHK4_PINIB|nr:hypothetical protein FSP39_008099 [Pinctada imbricata]
MIMDYSEQTFNRTRHFLRDQNLQTIDREFNSQSVSHPSYVSLSFPPKPRDPYNEVYDGIFIGDQTYSRDKAKLRSLGITHVVNCANGTRPNQINTNSAFFKDVGIKFMGIQANDVATYNLMPKFKQAAEFIHNALLEGGRVFVHCHMGVSRSATIVLAYLMLKQNIHLTEAVKILRRRREILPNDGFIKQLASLNYQLFEVKKS